MFFSIPNAPPGFGLFITGVIFLVLAIGGTFSGETLDRFHGWIYRTDDPQKFRSMLFGYYAVGGYFIEHFFFKLYGS